MHSTSGTVNVCPPSCLSPALILALCCPSQETHHFLGKQSCYYTILVHRCSSAHWPSHASGGEKGTFPDANLSPPHTNALCNASAFSKGSRVPYHWFCSQLACNSSLHRLMYQTHNETLFVFFFFLLWYWITTSFRHCSCGFGADGANRDQRTNVFHMSGWPPPVFLSTTTEILGKVHMIQNSKWFSTNLDYSCFSKHCLTVALVHRLV